MAKAKKTTEKTTEKVEKVEKVEKATTNKNIKVVAGKDSIAWKGDIIGAGTEFEVTAEEFEVLKDYVTKA